MSSYLRCARWVCVLVGLTALSACVTTRPASQQTSYGDARAVETVTNEFGSTDLQLMAEKMTSSLLESPVLVGRPRVTLSTVRNKTSEYVDTKNIMNTIQTALTKSGKVVFVRSIDEMQAGVDEMGRQNSGLYKEKARIGQYKGAKYSVEGELTSIVKQSSSTKDVFYKFTLKLYNVEEGTIEWQEEKEIRKTSVR